MTQGALLLRLAVASIKTGDQDVAEDQVPEVPKLREYRGQDLGSSSLDGSNQQPYVDESQHAATLSLHGL
jgi:hypothetical protein